MLSILSGYVSGEARLKANYTDPRFTDLDQSDVLDLFDRERQGVPLRVSSCPWKPSGCQERVGDRMIGEGMLSGPGSDFRDMLDERVFERELIGEDDSLGRTLDAFNMMAAERINPVTLLEHPRRKATLRLVGKRCGCDPRKGESCVHCCIKFSPLTVCVIGRTGDNDNLYLIELSDEQARKQHLLNKREIIELRRAFFRNGGTHAVLQRN